MGCGTQRNKRLYDRLDICNGIGLELWLLLVLVAGEMSAGDRGFRWKFEGPGLLELAVLRLPVHPKVGAWEIGRRSDLLDKWSDSELTMSYS